MKTQMRSLTRERKEGDGLERQIRSLTRERKEGDGLERTQCEVAN